MREKAVEEGTIDLYPMRGGGIKGTLLSLIHLLCLRFFFGKTGAEYVSQKGEESRPAAAGNHCVCALFFSPT